MSLYDERGGKLLCQPIFAQRTSRGTQRPLAGYPFPQLLYSSTKPMRHKLDAKDEERGLEWPLV